MAHDAQTWDDDRPIYRQLMQQIVAKIIDQTYPEGELLPSVRQIASDYLVNPLTAARAYRELGDVTETRRGIGLVVKEGVRELLLRREQKRFLRDEWPLIRERIKALELDPKELLKYLAPRSANREWRLLQRHRPSGGRWGRSGSTLRAAALRLRAESMPRGYKRAKPRRRASFAWHSPSRPATTGDVSSPRRSSSSSHCRASGGRPASVARSGRGTRRRWR